ncbi:MAG: DUF2207 domain-containing protein [Ardenticatenaceae bacterium]|nr:DUF2207 domain-containing protein [Ardenticatenaceae bacterium]
MIRKLWLFSVTLMIALLAAAVSPVAAQEKAYSADQFNVDVIVEEGGALLVTETVTYRFVGGPFTYVYRELPTDHTDGITVLETAVDGRSYPQGDQAGQAEIEGRRTIRVTWHFEPTVDTTRTFVLRYRVDGVVYGADGSDLLLWQALPDDYDYTIGHSTTTITYPSNVTLLGMPEIRAGKATLVANGNPVSFQMRDLQPDAPLVVALRFPANSIVTAQPAWQTQQQTQSVWTLVYIAIGAAIFFMGLAITVVTVHRINPKDIKTYGVAYEPPGKLSPGLAGALLTPGNDPSWAAALGTLFDLAEQGVLEIDESPEKKWYRQHDFLVRLLERPSTLQPHQEALLDLLFITKKGSVKTVKFSDLSQVVTSRRWKMFTETMNAELKAANVFSEERRRARSAMFTIGMLIVVVALGTTLITAFTAVGEAFLIVSGSLGALGMSIIIAGTIVSPLTDEAAQLAASWKQFADYLRRVSRGRETVAGQHTFLKYLPFAAAFGILPQWARYFEKEGWTELPPYFKVLPGRNPAESMAAFAAMSAASSSASTAGAAAAAGAGAAGGGAAGAG